jgi:hypothetical protein
MSATGTYTTDPEFDTCTWLVQVPSGCPEPDFESDCWLIVECGAPVKVNGHGSWRCEHGHEHVSFADPARRAYDLEQAYLDRQEG